MRLRDILSRYSENLSRGQVIPLDGLSGDDLETGEIINNLVKTWQQDKEAMRMSQVTITSILDTIPQGVFWKDSDSVFIGCNQVFADMIGISSPSDIQGKTDYELVSQEKARLYRADDVKVISTNQIAKGLNYSSNRETIWINTTKVPLSTPSGIFGVLGISEDITDQVHSEKRIRNSEKKFRLLAETVKDVIWMMNTSLQFTYVSPAITAYTGYTTQEAKTLPVWVLFPKETLRFVMGLNNEINRKNMTGYSFDFEMFRKDRTKLWASTRFTVLRDENGVMTGIIGSTTDISGRKRKEHELTKLANTDVLTSVLNRRAFMERLDAEISRSRNDKVPMSVLMLDIDHFKKINDTYGHPCGDQAIMALTKACESSTRCTDMVGRLGGEEFAMILPETPLTSGVSFAERLRGIVEKTQIDSLPNYVRITVSIGVTPLGRNDTADSILKRADNALYKAKNSGRNKVVSLQP